MNRQENKIISDKLESLDTLPEGYQPNVNSKWAVLEEAMDERTSAGIRINRAWLRIAACLVILFTSVSLYIYVRRTITVTINIPVQPLHLRPDVVGDPVDQAVMTGKKVASRKVIKANTAEIKNSSADVPDGEKKVIADPEAPLTKNADIPEQAVPVQPAFAIQLPAKVKRQRYVQVDFNSESKTPPEKQDVFAESFRIKLGIGNSSRSDKSLVNTSSIKLRRNF